MRGRRLEPLETGGGGGGGGGGGVQIPFYFRCPISLELMTDPVTLSTGQTYDRVSIESWIATGNTTCPVTRTTLTDFTTFIPNHTLRRLIQDWCVSNHSLGIQRIPTPKQPADPTLIKTLLSQISSISVSTDSRLSALRRLSGIVRESDKNRSLISTQNPQQILLPIVFSNSQIGESNELTHESLALLVNFPLSENDCESVASNPDRIGFLISLLTHSSIKVCINSASLIENVVSGTRSFDLRLQISDTDGLFEGITKILKNPMAFPRALKIGIKTLLTLCLIKQNRNKAIRAGVSDALIDRLADLEKCDIERALAIIELLCRVPLGCEVFGLNSFTIPLLVKIILKISERATEYAAGALLSLCSSSEKLQRDAIGAGVVTQLLLLVQSDCTDRGKRKAQLLLKLLRNSWSGDLSTNRGEFICSDVVAF